MYLLKLYVTDITPAIQRAIETLRSFCDDELTDCYDFKVIDIRKHPQLAEDERILAVPTLIKELPPPIRRVIGDLSDREQVLFGLDLRPKKPS
ncbi:Circadian clock protein KaiB [Posidoniimonas polymericola]|uniref:Circadian clock protein KaiB n=1 Tax=Posidoniimonas polymericola TaxID=2528002 RepID=A0A5C5YR51_9BACT|nr:circadian clock protein KaiB [Posidoniimonas polymericola]TWT77422.1 Circadian clock protein KaiB [Posidoniimonas polymericola]